MGGMCQGMGDILGVLGDIDRIEGGKKDLGYNNVIIGYNVVYCGIMGKRQNKYKSVKTLPPGAMSVAQYASNRGCNTSYIYKLWRTKKGQDKTESFEIIEFQGLNFVLVH